MDFEKYPVRIIVAGSRNYRDWRQFHDVLGEYLLKFGSKTLIISGQAPSGADALAIRWCEKYGHPLHCMPAKWDELGKKAGMVRNLEMVKVATHLFAFWDGESSGTGHMLRSAADKGVSVLVYPIQMDQLKDRLCR
jgi:hypothetical protein